MLQESAEQVQVSQLSSTETKYLRQATYKEERFILGYSFKGFNLWSVGIIGVSLWQGGVSQFGSGLHHRAEAITNGMG